MGGNDDERGSGEGDRSGVSRRTFVAGGLLLVGGSSALLDSDTVATFQNSRSATGSIKIDGEPTLNYEITDKNQNTNAKYQVTYQVEWVSDFDRIEVTITNTTDDETESFTGYNPEGSFSSKEYGGDEGDTFEFTFDVYEAGNTDPVIQKTTTDESGGGGTRDGNFGNANSSKLESFYVTDRAKYTNTDYTVDYSVSDANDFGKVTVTFDNTHQNKDWDEKTKESDPPNGTVSFSQGGTMGDDYEITVRVKNTNGITVDSASIIETSDGTDSKWSR